MKRFSKQKQIIIYACIFSIAMIVAGSCRKEEQSDLIKNNTELPGQLSDYGIFQGVLSDLRPANDVKLYELSTPLFTDYSEKQRLVKLPAGTSMTALGDGLPDFPEGTILVKTFFYYNDKRDPTQGKKIIETRILLKHDSKWNVGTYLWNPEQTDATLFTSGFNKTVNWIDETGRGKVISYHVPNNKECGTCHRSDNSIIPIGPKLRNLNMDVQRNSVTINQLQYFSDSGMINTINPSSFAVLPGWQNTGYPVEQRARAYFDVNCAHCHNSHGYAHDSGISFGYELSFSESGISQKKNEIIDQMEKGRMPFLGTTVVHEEGLALVKSYIESL